MEDSNKKSEMPEFSPSDFHVRKSDAPPPVRKANKKKKEVSDKTDPKKFYYALAGVCALWSVYLFMPSESKVKAPEEVTNVAVEPPREPAQITVNDGEPVRRSLLEKVEPKVDAPAAGESGVVPTLEQARRSHPELFPDTAKAPEPVEEEKPEPKILQWTPESGQPKPLHDANSPEADFLFK